ncbi:hypothetical protein V8J88_19810 [Massilia sp. W12]|uniref:hypothetical protein n=1 Tax=Massilia sp. W12 TaxID=3126507 RepID=UPI0030CC695A
MNQDSFRQQVKMLLRESFKAGGYFARRGFNRVQKMSGVQMLACAALLVLAIALLHLALFIFIVFSIFKLAVLVSVWAGRKPAAQRSRAQAYSAPQRDPNPTDVLPQRLLK